MRLEDIAWPAKLPVREDESLVFTVDSVGIPDGAITSDTLVLQKGLHIYSDSVRLEVVHFFAPKETYRQLGMLIMAGVFSSRFPELSVELEHERSELTRLLFGWDKTCSGSIGPGYASRPFSFKYYPEVPTGRHPLHDERLYLRDLPSVAITNEEEMCATRDEEYAKRRVVSGFGGPEGASRFAELLLNIGLPETKQDEFHLEGYPGFYSVSVFSAEIALWLPGSFGWENQEREFGTDGGYLPLCQYSRIKRGSERSA
jgi:hypothetical protein